MINRQFNYVVKNFQKKKKLIFTGIFRKYKISWKA